MKNKIPKINFIKLLYYNIKLKLFIFKIILITTFKFKYFKLNTLIII